MGNTNAKAKFYISTLPQDAPLASASLFAALTWKEVKFVGNLGETGTTTNMLTYPTWGDDVNQKGKGASDAGSPELEVMRSATDEGQLALRAAALTNNSYAFKLEKNDAPAGGTPTIIYNRGLVVGPRRPNGRSEDFDLEIFTLGLLQREIVVEAAEAP